MEDCNEDGFIGLGIKGKPMAKNLLKAGYDLVYDILASAVKKSLAPALRPALMQDVAARSDLIIHATQLAACQRGCFGQNGVLEGLNLAASWWT
ncbi:MAG: NAD(P)-binding domain-containing protein [Syntrophales bacterium LBB04]|nr:NAD(P)-binding domain-containing protein [Syntrophales bacterium LBB04]